MKRAQEGSGSPQPLGHHFDDSWKKWQVPERRPKPEVVQALGPVLSEQEVVRVCRAHFATFANLTEAAEHYGLTDGRLSQIQNGLYVSCPRVQNALGIKRDRSGVYRWISSGPVPGNPLESADNPEKLRGES